MVTRYIQPGEVLTLLAPTDVKSGDVVHVGAFVGVATYDAKQGQEVETGLAGVYELPKSSGALTQGQLVYWNADARTVSSSDGGDAPLLGAVVAAAGADAKVVRVRLNGITT